jgi:integrase
LTSTQWGRYALTQSGSLLHACSGSILLARFHGSKRYRIDTGTKDKKLAELWLKKVEELIFQVRMGLIDKIGPINPDLIAGKKKVKEAVKIKDFKLTHEDRCRHDLQLSDGTVEIYNYSFDSFIRFIGNLSMNELNDDLVRKWKRAMIKEGKSATTLSMYHRQLRAAFQRAVKWKFIDSNPFDAVEVSKGRQIVPGEKDMSIDEVRKLLATIDESGDERFGLYVRIVLYTGCRRNEILFLHWEDIDLVNRALKIKAEKTSKILLLPINKALYRIFEEIEIQNEGFVFQTKSNSRGAKNKSKPWHEDWATFRFKQFIEKAGLPDRYSLHSLRHTYATHLRQKEVPIDIVQKLLGHSSPRTTSDNYDHSVALHFRAQADLIDFEGE